MNSINNLSGYLWGKSDGKRFLKNKLKYSYKRGTPISAKGFTKATKLYRLIYLTEILREIKAEKLIINIDESLFTRNMYTQYSWLSIGWLSNIMQPQIQVRINVLT